MASFTPCWAHARTLACGFCRCNYLLLFFPITTYALVSFVTLLRTPHPLATILLSVLSQTKRICLEVRVMASGWGPPQLRRVRRGSSCFKRVQSVSAGPSDTWQRSETALPSLFRWSLIQMIGAPSTGAVRTAPALSFRSLIATFTTGLIPHARWPGKLLCSRLPLPSRSDSWFGTVSKGQPTGGGGKMRCGGGPIGGGGNSVGRRDRSTERYTRHQLSVRELARSPKLLGIW